MARGERGGLAALELLMKTHSDKERRRAYQKRQRAMDMRAMRIDPKTLGRCPGCGGRALLPCHKCYIDSLITKQKKAKFTA